VGHPFRCPSTKYQSYFWSLTLGKGRANNQLAMYNQEKNVSHRLVHVEERGMVWKAQQMLRFLRF
jgi:hypothetical protein